MGSGCETAEETVKALIAAGERVGVLKVRLFRPFAADRFVAALPATVRRPGRARSLQGARRRWRTPLSRCGGGPGGGVAPCHRDRPLPRVVGGRYGLSSKEFTPAMVKAVLDNLLMEKPLNHFSVGIDDDVTHRSLPVEAGFGVDAADQVRAVFYGLGSDGTVGGNKATIKIIGTHTDLFAQAYFVYDSKKSGSVTVSHLRFGPRPIRAPYLIERPTMVACHQWDFVDRFDLLAGLEAGGVLLLNSPFAPEESWRRMPAALRRGIRERGLAVWLINAYRVAREAGMGSHINTVMQACFFALSGVLPRDEAIERIRASIRKTYGRKGEAVVAMNLRALDAPWPI